MKVNNVLVTPILNNTIALLIMNIMNYVFPFLTLPYLSRVLEVDKLGIIFFAQVILDYLYRFMMFGFDFSGVRKVAINRDDKHQLNKTFSTILSVQFLFLLIDFIVMFFILLFCEKFRTDWIIYFFTILSLIGHLFLFNWLYQGMEKMKFITLLNLIMRSCTLILIFIIIKKPEDYYLVPLLNSSGVIISGFLSCFIAKKQFQIKFILPTAKEIFDEIKHSSQFFLSRIGIALYRQTNAFILGLAFSSVAVAYYVSADKIFFGAFLLFYAFINAIFPFMSKNKDIKLFKKMLKYVIIFAILTSVVLILTSKFWILLFFTEKMSQSINVLKILALSIPFMVLVDLFGFPLLGAFNYVKETNQGYILGGLINLTGLLLLLFLNKINIYTAAITLFVTYTFMFIHRMYFINKYRLLARERTNYDI